MCFSSVKFIKNRFRLTFCGLNVVHSTGNVAQDESTGACACRAGGRKAGGHDLEVLSVNKNSGKCPKKQLLNNSRSSGRNRVVQADKQFAREASMTDKSMA